MAVTSSYNDSNGTITLMHPNLKKLTFNPNKQEELNLFLKWIKPLCPSQGPSPNELYKVGDRGLTDTEYPSVSLLSIESLKELSSKVGSKLDTKRFRGNLWVSGGKPFEEFEGNGMHLHISLFKDDKNLFAQNSSKSGISKDGEFFTAGLLKHVTDFMIIHHLRAIFFIYHNGT